MKKVPKSISIIAVFLLTSFIGCKDREKPRETESKLAERKVQQNYSPAQENTRNRKTPVPKGKQLRYLFFANGGLIGYYNDGTVTGCPRCDFNAGNVAAMINKKPHGMYSIESGGTLLINGTQKEIPNKVTEGWALIDYKWYVKPPKT